MKKNVDKRAPTSRAYWSKRDKKTRLAPKRCARVVLRILPVQWYHTAKFVRLPSTCQSQPPAATTIRTATEHHNNPPQPPTTTTTTSLPGIFLTVAFFFCFHFFTPDSEVRWISRHFRCRLCSLFPFPSTVLSSLIQPYFLLSVQVPAHRDGTGQPLAPIFNTPQPAT